MRRGNRSLNHFMRGIGRQLSHRNNQNRKSGGYKKVEIPISTYTNIKTGIICMACFEGRHKDCLGYGTFMPAKEVNKCECKCNGK